MALKTSLPDRGMLKFMSEIITLVNANDEVIGAKDRAELASGDTYRIAGLWVVNELGHILLAQRAANKQQESGKWDAAVAGTVLKGESYEEAIRREALEELGLKNLSLTEAAKLHLTHDISYFCQCFLTIIRSETPLSIQEEEVQNVKWFSPDNLADDVEQNPDNYTPTIGWAIKHLSELG